MRLRSRISNSSAWAFTRCTTIRSSPAGTTWLVHRNCAPTPSAAHGWIRPVYMTLLTSHTILAVVILPLILVTLYRALNSDFLRHRKIAVWTFPLWLYVSVTGIITYVMLHMALSRG